MADDKNNIGQPDKTLVSLTEEYEIKYWMEKFKVNRNELTRAVKAVGNNAIDVQKYLTAGKN